MKNIKNHPIDKASGLHIIIIMIICTISILLLIFSFACFKLYLIPFVDLPGTIDSWIGASASIAGGAMTLIGVWWTIVDQDKKRKEEQIFRDKDRKEELAIQYKPILIIEQLQDEKIDDEKITKRKGDIIVGDFISSSKNKSISIKIPLFLKNVGRGEAMNIDISNDTNISIEEAHDNVLSTVLPSNEYTLITIIVDDIKLNIVNFKVLLTYTDLYHYFKYESKVAISVSITNKKILFITNEISPDNKFYDKETKL